MHKMVSLFVIIKNTKVSNQYEQIAKQKLKHPVLFFFFD